MKRTLRAFVEGIHFFKTQREASLRSLDAFIRLGEGRLLEETYQHCHGLFAQVPYADPKGIQNALSELAKKDQKAKMAKVEFFVESRFLQELATGGIIQRL